MDTINEVIKQVKALPDAEVELCGTWVWVEFPEKPDEATRDAMKAIGLRWSRTKSKWYWRPPEARGTFSKGKASMEYIRSRYGSQRVQEE